MVCLQVDFHENDGNHETTETMKTSQTATNKMLSAGLVAITETTEMAKTTKIQGADHRFPNYGCVFVYLLEPPNPKTIKMTEKWLKSDFWGSLLKWLKSDWKVTQLGDLSHFSVTFQSF